MWRELFLSVMTVQLPLIFMVSEDMFSSSSAFDVGWTFGACDKDIVVRSNSPLSNGWRCIEGLDDC